MFCDSQFLIMMDQPNITKSPYPTSNLALNGLRNVLATMEEMDEAINCRGFAKKLSMQVENGVATLPDGRKEQ